MLLQNGRERHCTELVYQSLSRGAAPSAAPSRPAPIVLMLRGGPTAGCARTCACRHPTARPTMPPETVTRNSRRPSHDSSKSGLQRQWSFVLGGTRFERPFSIKRASALLDICSANPACAARPVLPPLHRSEVSYHYGNRDWRHYTRTLHAGRLPE